MRVPRGWVSVIAREMVEELCKKNLVEPEMPQNELVELTAQLILDELTVEDRINREVRELLKKYEPEIEKGRIDYRKLFELTKQKLVRERNIIL